MGTEAGGTEVGSIFVSLGLDISDLTAGADQAIKEMEGLSRKMDQVGRNMERIGDQLTLGITAPLGAAAGAALKMGSDAEEMQAKMQSVFGQATDDVEAWAKTTADEIGRSRFQLQEFATTLQDTFVPLGFARGEAAEMSQQVAELAVDLASFNNIAEEDAIRKLETGLVGNTRALRDFGVVINQTRLENELLQSGLAESVDAASEQEKAQARLNLIMQDTADAHGNAAETADSFKNQMRALKQDVSELATTIGQDMLPVAKDFLEVTRDLTSGLSDMDEEARKNLILGGAALAALGPTTRAVGTLTRGVSKLTIAISGMSAAASSITFGALAGGVGGFGIGAIMDTTSGLGEMGREAQQTAKKMAELMSGIGQLEGENFEQRLNALADAQERMKNRTDQLSDSLESERDRLEQLRDIQEKKGQEAVPQSAIERQKALVKRLENELNTFQDIEVALGDVAAHWKNVGDQADAAAESQEKANRQASNIDLPEVDFSVDGGLNEDAFSPEPIVPSDVVDTRVFQSLDEVRENLRKGFVDSVNEAKQALGVLKTQFNEATSQEQRAQIQGLIDRVQKLRRSFENAGQSADKLDKIKKGVGNVLRGALSNVSRSIGQAFTSLFQSTKRAELRVERLKQRLKQLQKQKPTAMVRKRMSLLREQLEKAKTATTRVGRAFQQIGQTIEQALSRVISKLVSAVAQAAALKVAISLIPGFGQVAGASSFTGILTELLLGAAEGGFVEEGGIARIHKGESVVTAEAVEAFQEKIGSLGEVGDPLRGLAEQLSSALPEMSMPAPAAPELTESLSAPTGFFSELEESVTAALPEVSVPAPAVPELPESFSVPTKFFSELEDSITTALPEMSVPSPNVSLPDIPPVEVPMPDGGELSRMPAASGIGTIEKAGASKTRLAGGEVSVSIPVEVVNQANEAGVRSRARTGR